MEQRTLDRLGSAAGVPAAILSPLGFGLIASQGFGGDLTRRDVADAMSEASASVVRSGAVIDVLGAAFMLVFAARMYVLLRQAEGSNGWLSVLAAFGLLAGVIGSFVDKAAYLALGSYLGGEEVDAAEAVTLLHLSSGAFQAVQLFIGGLFVGGVALVSLRTGVAGLVQRRGRTRQHRRGGVSPGHRERRICLVHHLGAGDERLPDRGRTRPIAQDRRGLTASGANVAAQYDLLAAPRPAISHPTHWHASPSAAPRCATPRPSGPAPHPASRG